MVGEPPKTHRSGGLAVESRGSPIQLRPNTCAERIAVVPLDEGTVAQYVRYHGVSLIQLSDAIPPERRAAIARHVAASHQHECHTRVCAKARAWVREFATRRRCTSQTA